MSNYRCKHGFAVYARMMKSLDTPRTSQEMAELHGAGVCNVRVVLRGLYSLGLLRVGGWKRVSPVGIWDRMYVAGPGTDVPAPIKTTGEPSYIRATKTRPKPALIAFAALWNSLEDASSVRELVDETGIRQEAIYRFLKNAHQDGITRVVSWAKVYQGYVALYARSPGKDVPRPKAMSNAQQKKLSRLRAKTTIAKSREVFDVLTWRHAA